MNTTILVALIGGGVALTGIILKYWIDERTRKKQRLRQAVEVIHEKLRVCHEAMAEVLKNSPPEDDPHNTVLVNASRGKRAEFERALELQKLYLPEEIVHEAKAVCIQISRVVNDNVTWKEMRGTQDAKKYWEALQTSQDFLREKMGLLENHLQELLK